MEFIALVLIVGFFSGVISSAVASSKNRSGCGFFVLGFLIGPFAILGAAMMSRDDKADIRENLRDGTMRICPACAEAVKREAVVCRFCKTPLDALPPLRSGLERFAASLASIRRGEK